MRAGVRELSQIAHPEQKGEIGSHRLRWLDHQPFKLKERDRRPLGLPDNRE